MVKPSEQRRKEVKDDGGEVGGVQSMKGPCAKHESVDFLY